MRIPCPRCHHTTQRRSVRKHQTIRCTRCGALGTYQGRAQGFCWEFPQEPESRETNSEWALPSYLEAKVAAIKRQIPRGHRSPVCPVCGNAAMAGHCHHVWLSQRYTVAKSDLRNIIIVCNPTYANCHKLAGGEAKGKVEEELCRMLGGGDVELGRDIIRKAKEEWTRRSKPEQSV